MTDTQLCVNGDTLSLNNDQYLHINKVEVFTGDDDYNETDLIEVETINEKLIAKKTLTESVRPSKYRLRGEPGIRLLVASESGPRYRVTIAHHKGNIIISSELV